MRESVKVHPHMVALAERLRRAGFELAVASGSSRTVIDAMVATAGLSDLFPVRVSAEDVARGKPDPAVFQRPAVVCQFLRKCARSWRMPQRVCRLPCELA
ncbi:HAD family hydrolase [Streptomyces sp. 130]|uniref:HAD family hydrolase n=1 Tax=Streptomyces sp. 130 TaxID=2591006 RepID=UPI0037D9EF13